MNAFDERTRVHPNPFRPHAFFTELERIASGEVVTVATVFLTNRECPWRCIYCDLWKNTTTETVPLGTIPAQIDFALAQLWRNEFHESRSDFDQSVTRGTRLSNVRQIKLYNSGSFFDPKAIPPEDFPAIAERVRQFERVIVECHPALVGDSAVRFRDLLAQSTIHNPQSAIAPGAPRLEVAMGLEIADDGILAKLNKRMTLEMFRRAADFLKANDIALRAFVILKPPYVRTDQDALEFAKRSIDFAFDRGATVVSLIPARFGTSQLDELAKRGHFAPPKLGTLEATFDYGVGLRRGRVFADLWDLEALANCPNCFPARRQRLQRMNLQQTIEASAECAHCQRAPGILPSVSPLVAPARQDAGGTL